MQVIPDAFETLGNWLHQDAGLDGRNPLEDWLASLNSRQVRELRMYIEARSNDLPTFPRFSHVMRKHARDWNFRERDLKLMFQHILKKL